MPDIVIRSALAADDIRREQGGKPLVIGLLNPVIGFKRDRATDNRRMKLHFLLTIDVPEPGGYEIALRLRGLESKRGSGVVIAVEFNQAARQVPFPVGPLTISIDERERGFKLQRRAGERWTTVATWHLQDDPEIQDDPAI